MLATVWRMAQSDANQSLSQDSLIMGEKQGISSISALIALAQVGKSHGLPGVFR